MVDLKIISCNVRGLRDATKRRQLFKYFHERKVDIIFIQESHSTKDCEKIWQNEWGGKIVFDHGESNARGVAMLFAKNLEIIINRIEKSDYGQYIIVEARTNEVPLTLCNVYAPNKDSPFFFTTLLEKITNTDSLRKIVAGDFNQILDLELDQKGGSKTNLSNSANVINSFLDDQDWLDIWRVTHSKLFQFTWRKSKPTVMTCLDYFLIPQHVSGEVISCKILPGLLSDHSFVELVLSFLDSIKGRGFYKFNTSLLTNKVFVDEVNKIIDFVNYRYNDLLASLT